MFFLYFFIDFRKDLWGLFHYGLGSFYTTEDFIKYSKSFDLITSLLYFFNCAFVSGLTLNIAMKAKSRKMFLYFSPLITLLTALDLYKLLLIEYGLEEGGYKTFGIIFLFIGLIFGLANLYYHKSPGRKVFIQE